MAREAAGIGEDDVGDARRAGVGNMSGAADGSGGSESEGFGESPAGVEGAAAAEGDARDVIRFDVGQERSQIADWLHRGTREPLASMGLYHYSMYVYTKQRKASEVDGRDFSTYVFADTHPQAAYRVQKLRVEEPFRVPRLFGFTMPVAESNAELNAMYKQALLRPLRVWRQGKEGDAFETMVDGRGSFTGPFEEWYG